MLYTGKKVTLRKHAYSNILRILPPKNENFQVKNSDIFYIFTQNIDYGYSLEPPWWGSSKKYPQPMFLSRNNKSNIYPCKTQFYYVKVGLKGVWGWGGGQNYIDMFLWWCVFDKGHFSVQVSPVITRWSGCTNPNRDIGEARSKFGADWSDFINDDICMGHTYIHVWRDLWMKTMIFHVLFIWINEWVLTLYVLSFLHPLMYFFPNIYAKNFIYVSILWLDPPYLPVL